MREREAEVRCVCASVFRLFLAKNSLREIMASTLNFRPKKSQAVGGRRGGGTVRDAEQTKWQVIMLIGFAFWGRNIIRERPSQSKLRETRENSN